MKELLALLRAMQIYSHNAHHLCKGNTFFEDHKFFNKTYLDLEEDFDGLAERIIALYGEESLNLPDLMTNVVSKLAGSPSVGTMDNKIFFDHQLKLEESLCNLVKKIIDAEPTPGVEQLIGEMANSSEIRQYRIKQRLK